MADPALNFALTTPAPIMIGKNPSDTKAVLQSWMKAITIAVVIHERCCTIP